MLYFSMIISNMLNAFIFTQINHPLAMTLIIIIQTLIICISTGMMSKSFWFSYILFLVFLGGMLVLFIYITSLASNELFIIPTKFIITSFIIFMFIIILNMFNDNSLWNNFLINNDTSNILNPLNYSYNSSYLLTKLYNKPTDLITLLLVNYLFLTLIAIVKITNIFQGPLRSKY